MLNNILEAEERLPQFYIGKQIKADDLAILAEAGVKTIICNRPDGEEADQPSFSSIDAEATKLGIRAVYMPVTMASLTIEAAEQMSHLLSCSAKPVYAYCRSGGRVKKLCDIMAKNLL